MEIRMKDFNCHAAPAWDLCPGSLKAHSLLEDWRGWSRLEFPWPEQSILSRACCPLCGRADGLRSAFGAWHS
eukprot:15476574-Alexandrium_andersonii.AAC.1